LIDGKLASSFAAVFPAAVAAVFPRLYKTDKPLVLKPITVNASSRELPSKCFLGVPEGLSLPARTCGGRPFKRAASGRLFRAEKIPRLETTDDLQNRASPPLRSEAQTRSVRIRCSGCLRLYPESATRQFPATRPPRRGNAGDLTGFNRWASSAIASFSSPARRPGREGQPQRQAFFRGICRTDEHPLLSLWANVRLSTNSRPRTCFPRLRSNGARRPQRRSSPVPFVKKTGFPGSFLSSEELESTDRSARAVRLRVARPGEKKRNGLPAADALSPKPMEKRWPV